MKFKPSSNVVTVGLAMALTAATATAAPNTRLENLKSLSLEQLMDIEVSIMGKHPGKVSDMPAAVHVITADDIRRSTATRLPDLLRSVPGLIVAKKDIAEWAISARGFNDRYANKLLVMIDGRSIYSPMFSGTLWEAQDLLLDDIERIEVIRGPGASTWGANAVNGVINIITRHAADTQGLLAGTIVGNEQTAAWLRYGGQLASNNHYRLSFKHSTQDPGTTLSGQANDDDLIGARLTLRSDWQLDSQQTFSLQGQLFREDPNDPKIEGAHILGRWDHQNDVASQQIKAYWDYTNIHSASPAKEKLHTLDLDYSAHRPLNAQHQLSYGLGYRLMFSDLTPQSLSTAHRRQRSSDIVSAYIQDDITLIDNELVLSLGSKFEHNDFTGFEVQPSVRFSWKTDDMSTVWGAVSRAVRTPSRGERDLTVADTVGSVAGRPIVGQIIGNDQYQSEILTAFELGYRTQATAQLNLDLAAFYNKYDQLRSFEAQPGLVMDRTQGREVWLAQNVLANQLYGETYGLEVSTTWQAHKNWTLQASYSYINMQLHPLDSSNDFLAESEEGRTPQHQFSLHSKHQLDDQTELDFWGYYADTQSATGLSSYTNLDIRLARRFGSHFSVELLGRNLLDPHHAEIGGVPFSPTPHQLDREIMLKLVWTD